jgi:BolA protein
MPGAEMTVADTIERKVAEAMTPVHLEVINESHMHNVPPGSESHFTRFLWKPSPPGNGKPVAARRLRHLHAVAVPSTIRL